MSCRPSRVNRALEVDRGAMVMVRTPPGGWSMVWEPEVEELQRRRGLAKQMGGTERIARQHSSGKLTIRERIDRLADPGTFQEVGQIAGHGTYDDGTLVDFMPDSFVGGIAHIEGRPVVM